MWSTLLARTCSLANSYGDKIDLFFGKCKWVLETSQIGFKKPEPKPGSVLLSSLARSFFHRVPFFLLVSLPARLLFFFFFFFYLSSICDFVRDLRSHEKEYSSRLILNIKLNERKKEDQRWRTIVRRGRDEKCFGFLPSLRTNAPFFSIDRFVYRNLGCAAENDVASRY